MQFKSYEPAEVLLSKPLSINKCCYTCQWLNIVDTIDRNIPCSSRDWTSFDNMVSQIYPSELQFNKANTSDTESAFLDLHLSISNDIVSTKMYDKRDDFDFEFVNSPFLDGDIPGSTSYGVYISQLIRFARASNYITDLDLSIDEMVGACCLGCLSGPPKFTCWISFVPVSGFIDCWVLIFALSPFYILIYMF